MTYYALYDRQTGDYMHTGRNSTSMNELHQALLTYIAPDLDDEDDIVDASTAEIAEAWEFTIDFSDTRFPDDE